jgi:hypothetical protein
MKRVAFACCRIVPPGNTRRNCLAAFLTLIALGVLILNFDAEPAGAEPESVVPMPVCPISEPLPPSKSAGEKSGDVQTASLTPEAAEQAIKRSRLAMEHHIALLEVGRHRLEKLNDYSATFTKQERVDGEDLQDLQTTEVKLRHHPFSLYMKWIKGGDVGREVLLVDGQFDGEMLVHLGGIKGRLLPPLKIDPKGERAMSEARHPVTEMGLQQLCSLLLKYRRRDLTLTKGLRWELIDNQKLGDRECYCFVVEYLDRNIEKTYRKAITYVDKELMLPVCVRNYGWPADSETAADPATIDELTLIEFYAYSDIKFDQRFGDEHFDKNNSEYRFVRRQ